MKLEKCRARLTAADALAEATNNHILDPNDPHTFLELVKALREYREAK